VKIRSYTYGEYWTVKIGQYEIASDIYEQGAVQQTAPGWY
jgi:hypothetical protein